MGSKKLAMAALLGGAVLGVSQANAGLQIDLRATAVSGPGLTLVDNKNVSVTAALNATSKVTVEVWAKVTGTNGSSLDDGIQSASGSVKSTNINGGKALGNLANVAEATFQGTGWNNPAPADLDSDTDLDIGSNTVGGTGTLYIIYRSGSMLINDADGQWLLGTLTFSVNPGGYLASPLGTTEIQWFVRGGATAGNNGIWREDGVNKNAVAAVTSGTPVILAQAVEVIPTPGVAMSGLVGLGLVAGLRRRRQA